MRNYKKQFNILSKNIKYLEKFDKTYENYTMKLLNAERI